MPSLPVTDLAELLASLQPRLNPGTWAWCARPAGPWPDGVEPLVAVREAEGWTVVVTEAQARAQGWPILFRAAWLTLDVQSDLAAVGLTAAFSRALGEAGISCNVVAGAHHDHLFVPVDRADDALAALRALQARSRLAVPAPGPPP